MNFLALCQRTATECGVSGTLSTTVSQIGSLGRIVNWVSTAWSELQTKHDDWHFMRSSALLGGGVSFVPVAGIPVIPLGTGAGTVGVIADNFGKWDIRSFRNYTTAAGIANEMFMDDIFYDTWRDSYMLGAMRTVQTRPVVIAAAPNQALCIGPPSNGQYTVYGDYFVAPTVMALDTDVPTNLPVPFHMAIVYDAMRSYAGYEAAPEVLDRGEIGYARLMARLERLRMNEITTGSALA